MTLDQFPELFLKALLIVSTAGFAVIGIITVVYAVLVVYHALKD